MDNGNWTLIESDPGVFTELISNFGAQGLEVEEVWDLSQYQEDPKKEVFGLIFLFKWEATQTEQPRPCLKWSDVPNVFFAKQVIQNACATQAILSILMNIPNEIELGEELNQFKNFTMQLDPDNELLRTVHNSFARPEFIVRDTKLNKDDEDEDENENFHFVAYVPVNGEVYELDGLQSGPIHVTSYSVNQSGNPWIDQVIPMIHDRMMSYSGNDIRFSLQAVVCSKLLELEKKIATVKSELQNESLPSAKKEELQQTHSLLLDQLWEENQKHSRYKKENACRRHNFMPFIFELLKQMAKHECLEAAVKEAQHQKEKKTLMQ